jgi:cellobiose phosphorylase
MYRLGTEMILGLQRTGDRLHVNPCIPNGWPEYQINYRFGQSLYHILVKNQQKKSGKNQITMDGRELTDGFIPLSDDSKTHEIMITISARDSKNG